MRKLEYSAQHVSLATVCESLNEGCDDIDALRAASDRDRAQIASLRREITQLHVSLEILADLLAERGVLALDVLSSRLAARTRQAEQSAAGTVECITCHERVSATRTNVTAHGPVCDACYVPVRG